MRPVVSEPKISAGERPQNDASDRTANGTGSEDLWLPSILNQRWKKDVDQRAARFNPRSFGPPKFEKSGLVDND